MKKESLKAEPVSRESTVHTYLNGLSDGILWTDPEGHILFGNDSLLEKLGYTKEEIYRQTVSDIFPGLTTAKYKIVWESIAQGSPFQ